jgi:hypothetical protein
VSGALDVLAKANFLDHKKNQGWFFYLYPTSPENLLSQRTYLVV